MSPAKNENQDEGLKGNEKIEDADRCTPKQRNGRTARPYTDSLDGV